MSPRSPQPKKSRTPTTKKVVNKTVSKTRSGGVNAKAKKVKVKGDIVGRDKIMKAGRDLIVNVGSGQSAAKKPAMPLKKLWHTYCDTLIQQHRYLNLQGVGADPNLRVELETVYVSLKTNERERPALDKKAIEDAKRKSRILTEEKFFTAMEMASRSTNLVIIGAPGSGKSTFLSHLVVRFAEAWDKEESTLLRKALKWKRGLLLPIYVPLRSFNATLQDRSHDEAVEYPASLLCDYIMRQLDNLKVPDLRPAVEEALDNQQCLLLLDGLDEVPTDAQRKGVREAVENFVARYSNRAIVTCRTYAYHDASMLGGHFYKVDLQPFDRQQQVKFVQAWYQTLADQLGGDDPQKRADNLLNKINASARLPELASNPLLLTVMAYVHYKQVGLPERRVQLYEQCVRVMLDNWETARRGQIGGGLSERLGLPLLRDETTKLSLICPLAWRMHIGGLSDLWRADIEPLVLPTFRNLVVDDTQAREKYFAFLDFLVGRSGLLQEKDVGRYNFPHRTFQEYLTALWLISRGDWLQACFDHRDDTTWREVILLTVARLAVTQQGRAALDFIRALNANAVGPDRYRRLILAGECLRDMQKAVVFGLPGGAEIWDTVRYDLSELCDVNTITNLTMVERAEGGRVLGWLGDPRPDVSCDVPHMIEIQAGSVSMDGDYYGRIHGKHTLFLPGFYIGKYLVTNAQYRKFIEDGGYTKVWQQCWTRPGWKWCQKCNVTEPHYWNNPMLNIDNHPVVGVTWYEAIAYCNWLKAKTGYDVRLPTESEWIRSLCGDDGREWPWGNLFAKGEANTAESLIGQTTAVGLFPRGQSLFGLMDGIGNVREWMCNIWGEDLEPVQSEFFNNPQGWRKQVERSGAAQHKTRGGSWISPEAESGWKYDLLMLGDEALFGDVGFRVVFNSK